MSQNNSPESGLRLLARGSDDLEVLSALLQDAIIPGEDMTFDKAHGRFVMVANRFCWDMPPVSGVTTEAGDPVYQRKLAGVQVHTVTRVLQSGMPSDRKSALFNLLAVTLDDVTDSGDLIESDKGLQLSLVFSGGASLRLFVDEISVLIEDLAAAQPTVNQPAHDLDTPKV